MGDYVPSISMARARYCDSIVRKEGVPHSFAVTSEEHAKNHAEFDRMIAEVERAAAAQALEEAADGIESRRNEPGLVHLDARYAGYYTGIRSGMESDSKALRARAEAYRQERGEQ